MNPFAAVLQVLTSADEQVDAAGRRHVGAGHVIASAHLSPRPQEPASRSPAGAPRRGGRPRVVRVRAGGADSGSRGGRAPCAGGPVRELAASRVGSGCERGSSGCSR